MQLWKLVLARYFFHLRKGFDRLLDLEGREVRDPLAVLALAISEARALIADDVLAGTVQLNQRIEVVDDAGVVVHSVPFDQAVRFVRRGG